MEPPSGRCEERMSVAAARLTLMTSTKPGPNRVQAWIYGVINPLEEAVEGEALAGLRRNPSYRSRRGGLENLLPLRKYLTRSGSLILDDLATYYPAITDFEKAHDEVIGGLAWEAKKVFDRLVANEDFQRVVAEHFSSVCAPDTMLREVTECLVNDEAEYPDPSEGHFSDAWNRALPVLKRSRDQAGYQALEAKLRELRERSDALRDELNSLRRRLVEEFDVPPAPLHA